MGKQDIEYLKRLNDRERILKFRLERAEIETPNAVFIPDIKKELHAMEWGIEQIQSLTSRLKKAERERDIYKRAVEHYADVGFGVAQAALKEAEEK